MNTTEKKYAVSRIDDIAKAKRRAIELRTKTEAVKLSMTEKIHLIRIGRVKPNKDVDIPRYSPSLRDVFDFSKHEKAEVVDSKKRTKLINALTAEAHKVRDRVMLGDSEEALKLIEAFEKF